MSTDAYSHAVEGRRAKESARSQLQAAGRQALAAIMPAMQRLYRAMEESNRRRAAQYLGRHPSLFDDFPRGKDGG